MKVIVNFQFFFSHTYPELCLVDQCNSTLLHLELSARFGENLAVDWLSLRLPLQPDHPDDRKIKTIRTAALHHVYFLISLLE